MGGSAKVRTPSIEFIVISELPRRACFSPQMIESV